MTTIRVPVINEAPNTITVTFPSEYAISFEAANPDGVPAHCVAGGPGVLGGPEFITLLQRNIGSPIVQVGYSCEQFELAAYPKHTFYSFKNFTTGVKNVVAFAKDVSTAPVGIAGGTGAIAGATAGVSGATAVAMTFSTPVVDPVSFTWGGSAIGAITSGQGTTAMAFTVGTATGTKTVTMSVLNELGNTVVTSTNFVVS